MLAVRPQHGYDLMAQFQSPADLGRVWTMSPSQVYAVLKRLEQQGLIRGRAIRGRQAPDRVVYAVRPAGRRRVQEWIEESVPSASVRAIRIEFISKLHVADRLGWPLEPIIARQREACELQRRSLGEARRLSTSVTERRSLTFVMSQLDAAVAWLDGLLSAPAAEPSG